MIPAYSYETVCQEITYTFRRRYPQDADHKVRMVGLLFARPSSPLASAEIIPNLDYFHHRSGNNIDFFCAGYGGIGKEEEMHSPINKLLVQDSTQTGYLAHKSLIPLDRRSNLCRDGGIAVA